MIWNDHNLNGWFDKVLAIFGNRIRPENECLMQQARGRPGRDRAAAKLPAPRRYRPKLAHCIRCEAPLGGIAHWSPLTALPQRDPAVIVTVLKHGYRPSYALARGGTRAYPLYYLPMTMIRYRTESQCSGSRASACHV
jgi:hypothetical protein